MSVNIINQSSYKLNCVVSNGTAITLKKDESVSNIDVSGNSKVEIQVLEKNRVLLNLLFALIDGFVDGGSVVNSLVCNVSFNIKVSETAQTIIIKDLEYRDDKNGYIYESVYIESDNIENLSYVLINTEKARMKSLFYYTFVVSWLPIIIALLGYYFIFKGNVLAVIASLLILFIFAVPSWKKASKVKKYYSNEFANNVLIKQVIKLRDNKGKEATEEPKDILGKATYKALDFLFKNKK